MEGRADLSSPADVLRQGARLYGDKRALVTPARTLSYRELDEYADRAAAGLAGIGVAPGDTVSLLGHNRWEWIVGYHAILRAGAVANPLNALLTDAEVAYILDDCAARCVLAAGDRVAGLMRLQKDHASLRALVSFDELPETDGAVTGFGELLRYDRAAARRPDPSAPSTIGYTSGTTGRPKGAVQSHRAVALNWALTATMHVRTAEDVNVTALPAAHVYGAAAIHSTFVAGGTVVLLDRFDAQRVLATIEEHRATMFEGVPAMYSMMLACPEIESTSLRSLTRSTVGGQTIAKSVIEAWERHSRAPLLELWGMTELSGLGTTHPLYAPRVAGSIGLALPGVDVKVASPTDPSATAAPFERGELMVRGPIVTSGYHNNPDATARVIDPDGWLHTGDVAYADDSGYLYVVDRLDDTILTGGYNVYPAEIERVVSAHPAVALVAVGPVEDDVKGQLARAYVVLRPGHEVTTEEIIEHCRGELAPYKVPRSVVFVSELPTTSTGKLMRRRLRELDGRSNMKRTTDVEKGE